MQKLTIGKAAKLAGVGADTIRFYERERLLPEVMRSQSGYRLYSADEVDRLRFIRRAKALGFTLDEISELLGLSQQREHGVKGVKTAAQAKLARVEETLRGLQRVRSGLKALIAACPGHGPLSVCPILKALNSDARSGSRV